jgi:hypothetical protein
LIILLLSSVTISDCFSSRKELIFSYLDLILSYLILCQIFLGIPATFLGIGMEIPWNFLGNSLERNVSGLCYIIYMGSALPYDDKHDNEKRLIDCDSCGKRFLLYPDKIPTCNECLQKPSERRQRSRNQTPIAFLFDE